MLRLRSAANSNVSVTLLYSSRTFEDIIYREKLERLVFVNHGLKVVHTLTQKQPPGRSGTPPHMGSAKDASWETNKLLVSANQSNGDARLRFFSCSLIKLLGLMVRSGSAECERESLHARTKKLDFELAVCDGVRLPDELIEALFGHCAVA